MPRRVRVRAPAIETMARSQPWEADFNADGSIIVFIGFLSLCCLGASIMTFLFHETSGIASPRVWWLSLTGVNGVLLLYSLWSWVNEERKMLPADSWLGSKLGIYVWGVARGELPFSKPFSAVPAVAAPKHYPVAMPAGATDAWTCRWAPCIVVCMCYFYRSLWQHCTVERFCMEVWPRRSLDEAKHPRAAYVVELLLSPLMGRLVASVGEYVFVTRCLIPNAIWGRDARLGLRGLLTLLVVAAEIVSDFGVIKRHYGLFAVENSIWLVMFAIVFVSTLRTTWVAYSRTDEAERPSTLASCRMLALVCAFILIAYNTFEDVPMYWRLYQEKVVAGQADAASPYFGLYDLSIAHGVRHGLRCQTMLPIGSAEWRPVMLWMSLNYTALPLWMCYLCAITHRHAVKGFNEAPRAARKAE